MKRGKILFSLTILISTQVFAENDCFKKGKTWSTEGQLDFIPQIDFKKCTEAYLQNEYAKGFTWFEEFDGYEKICIIFGILDNEHNCKNCVSVKWKDECICQQQEGQGLC